MTGAGAPGAPGIIHCLDQDPSIALTVADADANATGRFLSKSFVQTPKGDDKNFIEEVLNVCKKKNIQVILPLVTRELFAFAKNKKLFEDNGIHVLVSSEKAINIANDKSACYKFLKDNGIAVPKFFAAKTVEGFVHAGFELGHPHKPFCFKPSVSNGSRGVRIVSDSLDEADLLFNYKPYHLHISYAHAVNILSSRSFPELLVSEYLPGDEYSVDCLAQHGKSILIVPRLRKKMINGISVQGEFINDDKITGYCKKIIEVIGLHGNIGIQLKLSGEKEPMLLEINPRVQGTIVAALGAGVNLPLLAIKQELDLPIQKEELEVKWGTKFSRYWTEVFY